MIDFDFVSPTKIYFGNNKEDLIGQICTQGGYKRVYIVIGQGSVKRNGLLSRVTDSFDKEGIKYQILEGVRPNPTIDLCHKGIDEARIFAPNLIHAIGGGSVIDTAKNIAVGYFYSGNSFDLIFSDSYKLTSIDTVSYSISSINSGFYYSAEPFQGAKN